MSSHRASTPRTSTALYVLAAALVPVFLLVAGVGLRDDGFFGGFAIGVALVVLVMIVMITRMGRDHRSGNTKSA